MPIIRVSAGKGVAGYKYGVHGHVYTYKTGSATSRDRAYTLAVKQGQAVKASQARGGKKR